jgi:hypothetical protein
MRTYVISYMIGTIVVFVLLGTGLTALGIAAAEGDWKSFEIAIGPIPFFSYAREHATATTGATTTTSLGIGVGLAAALVGMVTAGAVAVFRRGSRRQAPRAE